MPFIGLYTRVGHSCHFLLHGEELSTIPLSLRTIFYERKGLRSLFNHLFFVTFMLSRPVYGTLVCWYALAVVPVFLRMASDMQDITSIVFCLIQVTLCILTRVLNLYWTMIVCCKAWSTIQSEKLSNSIKIKTEDHTKKN